MSYARFDDSRDNGRISDLRGRLAAEVQAQTGEFFEIWQDRTSIQWGEKWKERIARKPKSVCSCRSSNACNFELTKAKSNRYKSDMPSKLNPKCAAIDAEIKDLQKDLQTASTGMKAGIVKEIKKLQVELAACKKKFPT